MLSFSSTSRRHKDGSRSDTEPRGGVALGRLCHSAEVYTEGSLLQGCIVTLTTRNKFHRVKTSRSPSALRSTTLGPFLSEAGPILKQQNTKADIPSQHLRRVPDIFTPNCPDASDPGCVLENPANQTCSFAHAVVAFLSSFDSL